MRGELTALVEALTLQGILLERVVYTNYRRPAKNVSPIVAELTPATSVVMGKSQQIARGAVVPLAGTVDSHHALQTTQVVILTNDIRI